MSPGKYENLLRISPYFIQPDEVNRAKKTASMPEPEKGLAAEGVHASGGMSQPIKESPGDGQSVSKS